MFLISFVGKQGQLITYSLPFLSLSISFSLFPDNIRVFCPESVLKATVMIIINLGSRCMAWVGAWGKSCVFVL